ncbi:MAG: polyketide cyclase [Verrucomicrobia bacterium]|nr:polyketide cyclase [Verrucomicrobiota bacterium]
MNHQSNNTNDQLNWNMTTANTSPTDRDLVLTRIIDAPREVVYKAWTTPELLKQWFAPLPYTTPHVEMDVRTGGSALFVMRSPDGVEMPNPGVYLEVIPNEKIVSTDAYTKAWELSAKPFMTLILTFEDAGNGKTKYTAIARHWNLADKEAHEKMGFHVGWGICTDQLEALVKKIK